MARFDVMWWQRKPLSEAERKNEIARLVAQRDKMLERTPKSFAMARIVVTTMFVLFVTSIASGFAHHPEKITTGAAIFLTVFGLVLLRTMWKLWVNPPARSDRWGISERLGYEGDSPREVQQKIDDLAKGR